MTGPFIFILGIPSYHGQMDHTMVHLLDLFSIFLVDTLCVDLHVGYLIFSRSISLCRQHMNLGCTTFNAIIPFVLFNIIVNVCVCVCVCVCACACVGAVPGQQPDRAAGGGAAGLPGRHLPPGAPGQQGPEPPGGGHPAEHPHAPGPHQQRRGHVGPPSRPLAPGR